MIRRVLAQARVEVTLTLRNGENLLATVAIPLGVLLFFSTVRIPSGGVDALVPGVLAIAVVSTSMVTLGIATAFERQLGVLRRLGVTPLGRGGLLAAKIASVLAVETLQCIAIAAAGTALGWRPSGGVPLAAGLLVLGTAAFAGLGFTLAGRLRAEANLAVANGLFIAMLMLGGVAVPSSSLPAGAQAVARALPITPLASSLRSAFASRPVAAIDLAALAAWAAGSCILAVTTFRWD